MEGRFASTAALKLSIAIAWFFLAPLANCSVLFPRFANDSCRADCTAFDIISQYYWQKQSVTATLAAATLIYIIDDRTNTTRTSTKTNELPAGVTPPPVNAQGTHVTTFIVETAPGESSQVVLAYPTEFTGYPVEYGWFGTLPTIDANGQSTCSVVDRKLSTQYVDYNAHVTPAQHGVGTVDSADPFGYIYSLMGYGCYEGADSALNPNDAAPTACKPLNMCGVSALSTVQFLTGTSVSHESSTPDPTPPPRDPVVPTQQPKQTPTPPSPASPAGANTNSPGPQPTNVNTPQSIQQPAPTPTPIVVGSQTIAANSQSIFVIAGQTLSPGGQVVAGGTTVSLARGGSIAVVNGATQTLVAAQPANPPLALTLDGQTVTANAAGQFVVAGTTLGVGSAVTLGTGSSKTTISLATDSGGHTVAVINGRSSTLAPGQTGGIGGAIASGLGSTGSGAEQFTGAGSKSKPSWSVLIMPFVVLVI